MKNNYSIYLIDSISVINIFGIILITLVSLFLCILLIINFINTFNFESLFIAFIFAFFVLFALYALWIGQKIEDNNSIKKISSTKNKIIIICYKHCQKQKFIFDKSDIKSFKVDFDASMSSLGLTYYIHYSANFKIEIFSKKECYEFNNLFQARGMIKSIFKIAKYIPNFSYSVQENCLSIVTADINKLAQQGKQLNFFELWIYVLKTPKVAILIMPQLLIIYAVASIININTDAFYFCIIFLAIPILILLCFMIYDYHKINK